MAMTTAEPATRHVQLAIVADDLTGALDTAVVFAEAEYHVVLPLDGHDPVAADVLAVTTETRDLKPDRACERVREAAARIARTSRPEWWYKKIDSALRGNPGPELAALLEIVPAGPVVVAPALPSQGRTVRDGRLLVDGVDLAETPLGRETGASCIAERLDWPGLPPVVHLPLERVRGSYADLTQLLATMPPALVVPDCETEADLRALAWAISGSGSRLACASGGLARHLVLALSLDARARTQRPPTLTGKPALVVAGSRHPAMARQLGHAAVHEELVVVHPESIAGEPTAAELDRAAAEALRYLRLGRHVAITTGGLPESLAEGRTIAGILAAIASRPGLLDAVDGLIVTGGDVAAATARSLGVGRIRVIGEVAPGVPWGWAESESRPAVRIVTKAGSFGADDVLTRSLRFLTGKRMDGM